MQNNVTDSKNNESMVATEMPKKGSYKIGRLVIVIFIASFFGAIFGFMSGSVGQVIAEKFLRKFPNLSLGIAQNADKNVIKQQIVQEDSAVIDVVEKSSPAVVSIIVSKDVPKIQDFFNNPFDFPNFINPSPNPGSQGGNAGGTQKQEIGGGSGFFVSADGMIVTNKHVIEDPSADYTVITSDGKKYNAKILAADPVNDIGIIKVDGNNFSILNFGNSDNLKIGQSVIAIGNSLGEFTNTVSKGIISGLKRNLTASGGSGESEQLTNIIQTDAAINPGNSGGPLLDINGDVVGINVARAQGAENIGFAIPVNQIKKVIDQVKSTGKISTPYIGVRYIPVDSTLQKQINFSYDYGVLVVRGTNVTDFAIVPGSPADKAGIVENDVILEVNGTKVDSVNSLSDLISRNNVGDEISFKIWHKGEIKDVKIKLAERAA